MWEDSCSWTAYCNGNSIWGEWDDANNPGGCESNDRGCTGTLTDCTVGVSGCCSASCNANVPHCRVGNGNCPDICTTTELKTGGSCSGCSTSTPSQTCVYNTNTCNAANYCASATCNGQKYCTNWTSTNTWDIAAPTYEWRASNRCGTETCTQTDVCGIYDTNADGASENYTFVNYLSSTCPQTCGVDGLGNPNCLNCCETTNKQIDAQTCDPSVACSKKTCNNGATPLTFYCQYDPALAKWTWKTTTSSGTRCEGTTAVGCTDYSKKGSTIKIDIDPTWRTNYVDAPIEEGGGGCVQFRCNGAQQCIQGAPVLDACSGSTCSGIGSSKSCTCSGSDCTLRYSRCDAAGSCVVQTPLNRKDGCSESGNVCDARDNTCKNEKFSVSGTDFYPGLLYYLGGPKNDACPTDYYCANPSATSCSSKACPTCTADPSICNDNNPCTDDVCNSGVCVYNNNAVSCDGNGDACMDACLGGTCSNIAPCACTLDSQCDDTNVCTDDKCISNVCDYSPNSDNCGETTCPSGECDGVFSIIYPEKCTKTCSNGECETCDCISTGKKCVKDSCGATCGSNADCAQNEYCDLSSCGCKPIVKFTGFSGLNCPTLLEGDSSTATVKYAKTGVSDCDASISISGSALLGSDSMLSPVLGNPSCNDGIWTLSFDSFKNGTYVLSFDDGVGVGAEPVSCSSKRVLVQTASAPDFNMALLPVLAVLAMLFARRRHHTSKA